VSLDAPRPGRILISCDSETAIRAAIIVHRNINGDETPRATLEFSLRASAKINLNFALYILKIDIKIIKYSFTLYC
jgi:hypothetical protein